MNLKKLEKINQHGIVERRLFDRKKFSHLLQKNGVQIDISIENDLQSLYLKAIDLGVGKKIVDSLLEESAKLQFADNIIWKIVKKVFKADIKLPFITGIYTKRAIRANLIVNTGHKSCAQQLGGTTTSPQTAIAIGTGTTAAAATDTALQTEITTNGGARGAATVSNVTTSTSGDTEQWVKTFNFTGSFAVTEEGIFDNNSSGGNMLAHQVFTAVNVVSGDSLQITHKVQC